MATEKLMFTLDEEKQDKIKILCCPFCGGTAEIEIDLQDNGCDYWVFCTNTPCIEGPNFSEVDKAVNHWNQRSKNE